MKEEACYKAEDMLAKHIGGFSKYYETWLKKMYKILKDADVKKTWFGDMDTVVELILDTPEKKVFTLRSTCTCADISRWLIVWDNDGFITDIHVRQLHDHSDYPKKQYPKKLGLRFYKDRGYVIEYIDKLHWTNLGNVYGDIRDKGYVISYEIRKPREIPKGSSPQYVKHIKESNKFWKNSIKDSSSLACFYNEWKQFTFYLKTTEPQIDAILSGKEKIN